MWSLLNYLSDKIFRTYYFREFPAAVPQNSEEHWRDEPWYSPQQSKFKRKFLHRNFTARCSWVECLGISRRSVLSRPSNPSATSGSSGRAGAALPPRPRDNLYLIFEIEAAVTSLLSQCNQNFNSSGGSWYHRISSRRMRNKEVQIIPLVLADSNFVRCPSQRLDPQKTVFVGAGRCTECETLRVWPIFSTTCSVESYTQV